MRMLLVEDDAAIVASLTDLLRSEGYETRCADGQDAAVELLRSERFDLALVDVALAQGNGFAVCAAAKACDPAPAVIFLTASDDEFSTVAGLDMGADDYIAKPFNPRELLARIHAVLRRRPAGDAPGAPSLENETVRFGEFELDLGTRVLKKNGEVQPLTTGEFAVLKAFARHPRQPLSRDKLMEMARGREYEAFDRSLDVQVSRLRKLIEPDPSKPRYLQTVWGLGYVFIPDGHS